MSNHELAQLNIARLKAPIDSPLLAQFVANLDRINKLADSSEGFRWRLMTPDGDATSLRPFGNDVIVNMSVWRDLNALQHYVYRTAHVEILKRRQEWFTQATRPNVVLWWVPFAHRPSISEAAIRLSQLRGCGPTPAAFTFAQPFPAPEADSSAAQSPLGVRTVNTVSSATTRGP